MKTAKKKSSASAKKVAAAFREVTKNEPSIVGKTRKKKGEAAAKKQKVAIALSKARKAGAKVPEKKSSAKKSKSFKRFF